MSHLDEGTFHALLDGEISSTELSEVQAHLAACPECRARLEQERLLVSEALDLVQMVEVPEEVPALAVAAAPATITRSIETERTRRINWTRGLAWAASVIGAVGLGYAARGAIGPARTDSLVVNQSAQPLARSNDLESRSTDSAAPAPPAGSPKPAPAPPPPARQLAKAADQPRERVDSVNRLDEMRPAPTAPAAGLNASGAGAFRDTRELSARAEAPGMAQMKLAAPLEALTFPEALRRLDGSIRLIPGLIPSRLEAQGTEVRVVYPTAQGELILRQELVNGQLIFRLSGPPGFPADSLERLRMRVRE